MKSIPKEIEKRLVFRIKSTEEAAPPVLKKIDFEETKCEDCSRMVKNRMIDIKLCTVPKNHWRYHCKSCNRCRNPNTGKYDLTPNQQKAVFKDYFCKKAK